MNKKMTTPIEKQFKIINERYNKTKQQVLTKQNKLQKLSNTLYEVIDKHYTEAIESNNKTAIIQAETELTLIIEIQIPLSLFLCLLSQIKKMK